MCFRHCMARFRMCVRLDFHKCADECAGIVVAGLIMQMDDAGGIVGVFLCKCAVKRLLQAGSDLCIAACVMPVCSGCHGDGGVDQRIAGCTCDKDCKADQSQTVPLPVFVRLAIALCFERGKQFHAWEPPADESMRESQREYGKVRGNSTLLYPTGFYFSSIRFYGGSWEKWGNRGQKMQKCKKPSIFGRDCKNRRGSKKQPPPPLVEGAEPD